MGTARLAHSAVLLGDGRVLVVGGLTPTATGLTALATAALFQPGTGQWATTGTLSTARANHSATRLLDSRVLVVGGSAGAAGFQQRRTLRSGRRNVDDDRIHDTVRQNDDVCCPGTALLPSGDVLVGGGSGAQGAALDSAEIYRVAAGAGQPTGNLLFGRDAGFSLIPVLEGRILITGGRDDWGALPYAELYDEGTGRWTRTNDAHLARMSPATAALVDGRVLVIGGGVLSAAPAATASAETFSPI
jgi:hypothetical protein